MGKIGVPQPQSSCRGRGMAWSLSEYRGKREKGAGSCRLSWFGWASTALCSPCLLPAHTPHPSCSQTRTVPHCFNAPLQAMWVQLAQFLPQPNHVPGTQSRVGAMLGLDRSHASCAHVVQPKPVQHCINGSHTPTRPQPGRAGITYSSWPFPCIFSPSSGENLTRASAHRGSG